MRGLVWFAWLFAVIIAAVVAFFVAPIVLPTTTTPTTTTPDTPQLPPVQPAAPAQFVVDSIKFCQAPVDGICTTHSTSFSNPNRVYVTAAYSKAEIGKVVSFMWYKKTGITEEQIAGDAETALEASGNLNTGLGQTPEGEGMPLTTGTYVFKVLDEAGKIMKAAEFVVA